MEHEPLPGELLSATERLALQDKIADPTYLPTFAELQQAFTTDGEWQAFRHRDRTVESMHELLCQEYIQQLANHLITLANKVGATAERPLQVVEVGAGDGRLTYFIEQTLSEKERERIKILATDAGLAINTQDSWSITPVFPVEPIDYQTALANYHPNVIISSWMPPRQDWTQAFRRTASVQEYLLIGPSDSDRSGQSYLTWGQPTEIDVQEYGYDPRDKKPYQHDGFERTQLVTAEHWQVGGNDPLSRLHQANSNLSYSATSLFRRTGQTETKS